MPYYITTPLYYVNDFPHIGHAYTTLAADIWTRARRLFGDKVFFLTGTDEHGGKIAQAARAKSMEPKAYADSVAQAFGDLWKELSIDYDDFIRTTEPRHEQVVQMAYLKLKAQGDIVASSYEDWYCTPCETFIVFDELVDGKFCPTCGRAVEKLKEEGYFFKLSKYQQRLQKLYQDNPNFLSPKSRAKEVTNFVDSGLKDLSITRNKERIAWGVAVPDDARYTIYVWFDALLNYISALGESPKNFDALSKSKRFQEYWPASVHLVGKEIFRFHAVTWPAMLMALGLEPPQKVFAHGWWTVEGEKMSKSRGNFVNTKDILKTYPADSLRYYLFREMPLGSDGDFSSARLKEKHDQELANVFSNLGWRVASMIEKYFGGRLTKRGDLVNLGKTIEDMKPINQLYFDMEFYKALELIYKGFSNLNIDIDQKVPWRLASSGDKEKLEGLLFDWFLSLSCLTHCMSPFCPNAAKQFFEPISEFRGRVHPEKFLDQLTTINSLSLVWANQKPLFMRSK